MTIVQLVSASAIQRQLHREGCMEYKITWVARTSEDPWCFVRSHGVAARHGQVHILGEVFNVINGLLNVKELQALLAEVR